MTLLKAYLIGSNDPFVLARVYHDEYILKGAIFIRDYIDEKMELYRNELKAQKMHLDNLKDDIFQSIDNLRTIQRNYEVNIWAAETTLEEVGAEIDNKVFNVIYEGHRKQFKEDMDNIKELRKLIPKQKKLVKDLTQEFERREKELYSKYAKTTKEQYSKTKYGHKGSDAEHKEMNKFGLEFEKLGLKLTKKMAEETVDEKGVPVLQVPDSKAVMNVNKKYKEELDRIIRENEKDIADPDKSRSATKIQPKTYIPLMGKWNAALKEVVDDKSGVQYFKKYYTDKIKGYENRIKMSKRKIKALKAGKNWGVMVSAAAGRETELTRGKKEKVEPQKKKTLADMEVIDALKEGFPTKASQNKFYNELSAWIEESPELFNIPVIVGYKKEGRDKAHTVIEEGGGSARNRNLLRLKEICESAPAGERDVDTILRIINTELDRVKETPASARKKKKEQTQYTSILDWYRNLNIKLVKLKEDLISVKGKALPQKVKNSIRKVLNLPFKSLGQVKGGTPVKKVLLTIAGRSITNAIYELHPIVRKRPKGKGAFISDLEKLYESIKSTLNHKVEDDTILEYIINIQTKRKIPQFAKESEEDIKALEDVTVFLQRGDIKGLDEKDEDTLEDILKELVSSYNRLIEDENLSTLDKEGKAFKEILSIQLPKAQRLIEKMPEQHEKKKELIDAFRNLSKVYGKAVSEVSGTTLTRKAKNKQMVERVVEAYHKQLKNLDEDEQRKFLNAMLPFEGKAVRNRWVNTIMRSEKESASLMQELEALGKVELGAFAQPKKTGKDFLDVSGLSEDQYSRLQDIEGKEELDPAKQITEVRGDYEAPEDVDEEETWGELEEDVSMEELGEQESEMAEAEAKRTYEEELAQREEDDES